jgi:aminoglycoside phosphotransferase
LSATPTALVPDAVAASDAALRLLGSRAVSVVRFTTGRCHWVFDVRLETGASVVLRMTTASLRPAMRGALYLNELLRPTGVPLPRVLHADLDATFPTLVLERLAGTDLGHVMASLDGKTLEGIAGRVAEAQGIVSQLPSAGRYGFAVKPEMAMCASWPDVLAGNLARSRRRLSGTELFPLDTADRVEALLGIVHSEATQVSAAPFLHDTTTKNVIVTLDGRLSGIVDVDDLCWGDPRFAVALTLAAVQAFGGSQQYVAAWMRLAGFRDDRLFRAYVALFVLDLLSEQGTASNGNEVVANAGRHAHLLAIFERTLMAANMQLEPGGSLGI